MFPGVITPVPLAKTPVRAIVAPAVTAVGLAVKLVIAGSLGFPELMLEQPVRTASDAVRASRQRTWAVTRFMESPEPKTGKTSMIQ
jgi:hypothetical protein